MRSHSLCESFSSFFLLMPKWSGRKQKKIFARTSSHRECRLKVKGPEKNSSNSKFISFIIRMEDFLDSIRESFISSQTLRNLFSEGSVKIFTRNARVCESIMTHRHVQPTHHVSGFQRLTATDYDSQREVLAVGRFKAFQSSEFH
jgi:hypothetical protein